MTNRIRRKLIELARNGEWLSYSELDYQLKLGVYRGPKMNRWLTDISEHEMSKGRPVLSVLIVNKNTKKPGKGFTNLFSNSSSLKIDKAFIKGHQQECFSFWQKEKNYKNFLHDEIKIKAGKGLK